MDTVSALVINDDPAHASTLREFIAIMAFAGRLIPLPEVRATNLHLLCRRASFVSWRAGLSVAHCSVLPSYPLRDGGGIWGAWIHVDVYGARSVG